MDVILCVKKIENEIIYSNLERDRKRVKEKKIEAVKAICCVFLTMLMSVMRVCIYYIFIQEEIFRA